MRRLPAHLVVPPIIRVRLQAHRSNLVLQRVGAQRGAIALDNLLASVPGPKREKCTGGHLTYHDMPNYCAADFGALKPLARHSLRSMQRCPTLEHMFWERADLL
jgi:hypothetical protein